MKPVCKVQIYDFSAADALLYTFDSTTSTTEAYCVFDTRIKSRLTEGLGTAHFSLPSKVGLNAKYTDIAPHDKVEISLGFETLPATPTFTGRITTINGHASPEGYVRRYDALDLGEVLPRRIKKAKYWYAANAHTIADAIAGELSLVADTDADANAETVLVADETYFDLLKRVSDYYVDATHQVSKDFYVYDNAGVATLAWKTRPIRVGTETLELGKNILSYQVTSDVDSVKNKIYVYGQKGLTSPSDRDAWTEDSTVDWSCWAGADVGVITSDSTAGCHMVGDHSIKNEITTVTSYISILKTFAACDILSNDGYDSLVCWTKTTHPIISWELHLLAPDINNFYAYGSCISWPSPTSAYFGNPTDSTQWNSEFRQNLNEISYVFGSPSITNVQGILFYLYHPLGWYTTEDFWIDGLRLEGRRYYSGAVESGPSQTNFGIRELVHISDKLISNAECVKVANTFLYQQKDLPKTSSMLINGNTDVRIGDRLTIVLPEEGIPATFYYVFAVEHFFNDQGFQTIVEMSNLPDLRRSLNLNMSTALTDTQKMMRKVAQGDKFVGAQ